MVDIKEVLNSLDKEKRLQLMMAFNDGLSDYIEYEPGYFIGVNLVSEKFPNLKITNTRGSWCIGEVNDDKIKR
jgi:hypothetical protein